jgi:hypothetical protein
MSEIRRCQARLTVDDLEYQCLFAVEHDGQHYAESAAGRFEWANGRLPTRAAGTDGPP